MDPSLVDVVLVRAKRPGNVAAACRAMKNTGLGSLWLVDPPPGLAEREVRGLAYGAWDVLDSARSASGLAEAVAGSSLVVSTSGRAAPEAVTPRQLALQGTGRASGGRVSLVFGPEDSGLNGDELALCSVRVHIPAHPAQPSLNLAQAVLILGYEIFLSREAPEPPPIDDRATTGELEGAVLALGAALRGIGYLNPQNPGAVLSEIRGLLARAGPTTREVALLRGIARQVSWAADAIARTRGEGG